MSEEKQPFNPNRGVLSSRRGGKAARLPSLRTPRDLTLGGVQKKTFAPNIPARRKQEEAKLNTTDGKNTSSEVLEQKKSHIGAGHGDGKTKGRRYEKRKADVVQSHSIFEQGPSEKAVKPSSGYVNYGDGERSSTSKKTTIKRERVEDKETKQILEDLLRDDFIADDRIKTEDPSMMPVRLPLSIKSEIKTEPNVKPLKTVKVKAEQESTEGMVLDPDVPVVGDEVDIPSEQTESDVVQPLSCAELLHMPVKSDEGHLVFIQLPDTLPGEPLTKAPVEKVKEEKSEKSDAKSVEDNLADKLGQVSLADFKEGHIGKLQVLKSGRTRLRLGNNSLDVMLGTPAGFLQELVSVRLEGKTGDMFVLGHINHKLVCLPDMESLLESR